jgi:hypothetical protein
MSSILKAPWQVGLAAAATFIAAADYIVQALAHLALMTASDSLEQARQAGLDQMMNSNDSAVSVLMIDDIIVRVFIAVGVGLLILGVFLWSGAFRGGIRGILTVTLAASFFNGGMPLVFSLDLANGFDVAGLIEGKILSLVALIFVSLLWGKAGKKWVAMGAKKKWDED